MEKYKTIKSEVLFENNWWQYIKEDYVLPSSNIGEYHYVKSPGSVFIIPRTNKNTYYMIRQYRYLNKRMSIEFPGGGCIKGLRNIENAKKELKEEAGLETANIVKIGEFNPYNGVTNEICELFLATDLTKVSSINEESEEIEVLEFNTNEIIDLIIKGEIWDGMTLASWSIYNYYVNNNRWEK